MTCCCFSLSSESVCSSAEIQGSFIEGGFIIPISSIKNENKIYVIDHNNKLQIKEIEVFGTDEDNVIIRGDITEDEMIIVSAMNSGFEGMELTPMLLEKNTEF